MNPIAKTSSVLLFVVLLIAAVPGYGASEATKTRTFPVRSVNAVVLKAGVGGVRVEPSSTESIEAQVTLRAKRNTSIFGSVPDVEKLDISATTRGEQLELDIDAKNIEEQWVLKIPKKVLSSLEVKLGVGNVAVVSDAKRLEVDLGVGDVELDAPTSAVAINVGTGDARVKTELSSAGPIEGTSGVGSVSLTGLEGTVKSRAVGGKVTGKGRGQQPIEVTVGVGDLTIELTQYRRL